MRDGTATTNPTPARNPRRRATRPDRRPRSSRVRPRRGGSGVAVGSGGYLADAIAELEKQITTEGLRGRPAPRHASDEQEDGDGKRRVRSTKRRQDAPELPCLPGDNRTIGRTCEGHGGQVFRPSMFLTLTLESYGRVHSEGTPVDPDSYDYRRACTARKVGQSYATWEYSLISPLRIFLRRTRAAVRSMTGRTFNGAPNGQFTVNESGVVSAGP
ncbi:hypothetical protein [Micromonospora sp. NPDC005806]|uniref:hypothetical protein n=1 Tax=Micromonospora sp. NPDC005806 TaxID=3364234 RepID=UPI0036A55783